MKYDESQIKAIKHSSDLNNKLSIITGGGGYGKTECIKNIIQNLNENCELLASTGKASARMQECTGKQASTCHRALQYDGTQYRKYGNFEKPLIIDECSLIPSDLFCEILKRKPPKIILVGDDAQLEPVGIGSPFKDLIKIRPDCVNRLTVCHRASGAIHKASQAVRNGQAPLANDKSDGESFKMVETGGATQTIATLLKWVEAGYYNPKTDMILSPRYESDAGIDNLNAQIKAILNPSDTPFEIGDRIIVVKNHADEGESGIWNGDLGFIIDINTLGEPEIQLDRDKSKTVLIKKKIIGDIKLAYALSVHKAQGSEAQNVFVICQSSHFYQLSRSLIYTAITRAKKGCVVMGQMAAFYSGINKINEKKTVLNYLWENL